MSVTGEANRKQMWARILGERDFYFLIVKKKINLTIMEAAWIYEKLKVEYQVLSFHHSGYDP